MIINNIEKIRGLLVFSEDIYYYLQVLKRKKDNPELRGDKRLYSTFITSADYFSSLDYLISLCDTNNARIYISIIPRSLKKLGLLELSWISDHISTESYKRIYEIADINALNPETSAWRKVIDKSRYLLDVDSEEDYERILLLLNNKKIPIEAVLKTPFGYHLVVPGMIPERVWGTCERDKEDYIIEGTRFTLRHDCNVLLYCNLETL